MDDLDAAYKKYTGDSSLAEGHDPGQTEKIIPSPAKSASTSLKQLEKDATNQAVELLQKRLVFWLPSISQGLVEKRGENNEIFFST